jgi:hypothetical protein
VAIANADHNGVVRIHLDQYLGQAAQSALTKIADKINGIADATILPDKQVIVLEASDPANTQGQLKRLFNRFTAALKSWFDDLDTDERELMVHKPDLTENAYVYSHTGIFHTVKHY